MSTLVKEKDLKALVETLNFKQKVERSKELIRDAYRLYGDRLVVANSLGKDSVVVWDLAKKVEPSIRGFIVTTRFKPAETVAFMNETVKKYPELKIYKNDTPIPSKLYETNPDVCCDILKVEPVKRAIEEMDREHKERKAALTEKLVALENWFSMKAQEDGLETIKTPAGTAYWSKHQSATVASREDFFNFRKEHDASDMVESRASKTAVRSYLEAHGEVPPGINYNTVRVFNFRKNQVRG